MDQARVGLKDIQDARPHFSRKRVARHVMPLSRVDAFFGSLVPTRDWPEARWSKSHLFCVN